MLERWRAARLRQGFLALRWRAGSAWAALPAACAGDGSQRAERRDRLRRVVDRRSADAGGRRGVQRAGAERPDQVDISGTGGGFERFCAGETDVQNASRAITNEERSQPAPRTASTGTCSKLPTTASRSSRTKRTRGSTCLTTDQLKQLWQKDSSSQHLGRSQPRLPGRHDQSLRTGNRLRHVRLLRRGDPRRRLRFAKTSPRARTTTCS